MWVSVQLLLIITIVLGIVLYIVEHLAQPKVYVSIWDSLVWSFMQYIGDPGAFGVGEPVTLVGRIIATIIGTIGIAIFAVPAGLIGSGFIEAMAEDKRAKELAEYRSTLRKAFKRLRNVSLKEYLNKLPDGDPNKGRIIYLVPDHVPVTKLQVRNGMRLNDIMDTIHTFPEFRLTNTAQAQNGDEKKEDRMVVAQYPINRSYGCCIKRGSKVTIVSTSSSLEVGTGWFAYYLAKFGGFNFISKEIETDPDEIDSFYNMPKEPKVDEMTRAELEKDKKANKKQLHIMELKERNRANFISDLKSLCTDEDSWLIFCFTSIMNNTTNTEEFHFSCSMPGGKSPSVTENKKTIYNELVSKFQQMVKEEFDMSAVHSTRYVLSKPFVGYKLKEQGAEFNAFLFHTGGHVVVEDSRKQIILFRMAETIKSVLDPEHIIEESDLNDLMTPRSGYLEQEVDQTEVCGVWYDDKD